MGSFLYQKCKENLKYRIFEELNLILTVLLCLQEDVCGYKMWFQIREEVLSSSGHLRSHLRIPGIVEVISATLLLQMPFSSSTIISNINKQTLRIYQNNTLLNEAPNQVISKNLRNDVYWNSKAMYRNSSKLKLACFCFVSFFSLLFMFINILFDRRKTRWGDLWGRAFNEQMRVQAPFHSHGTWVE